MKKKDYAEIMNEIEVDNTGKPVRKIYDDGRIEEP